jgi:hypothetical protein
MRNQREIIMTKGDIFKQAQQRGYMVTSSLKVYNEWYRFCKSKEKLFVCIANKQKYCHITVDSWGTPHNFSDTGQKRILSIVDQYKERGYKDLKKGAMYSIGKTYGCFSGFPKADSTMIAENIIRIWGMEDSRVLFKLTP